MDLVLPECYFFSDAMVLLSLLCHFARNVCPETQVGGRDAVWNLELKVTSPVRAVRRLGRFSGLMGKTTEKIRQGLQCYCMSLFPPQVSVSPRVDWFISASA